MSKVLRAHIAVIIVNLLYGANFTIAKTIMPSLIKPFGFIVIRITVVAILFFLIAPFMQRGNEKIDKKDIPRFILCGLTGVAVNQMLFFKGLSMTFPINGAIIMTTSPILVIIIAAILVKEAITLTRSLGIILGAIGAVWLLAGGRSFSFGSDTFTGDVCIFINAMSYGVFMVISKPLLKKYSPINVIKWCFFFGFMFAAPFGWTEFVNIPWSVFGTNDWLAVSYVVIGTTFFAYLLNTIALNTLSPSVVSSYIYMQPLIASAIALASGKDRLSITHIVSSLLIFLGVYFVSKPTTPSKMPQPSRP